MKIRRWLERNEIFFKTLIPIFLGAIGVLIAVVAHRLADGQAKFQETMARLQSPAIVRLIEGEKAGDPKGVEYTARYYVQNDGGPLLDFDLQALVFTELLYGPGTDSDCLIQIFVRGSGLAVRYDGNTTGRIAEVYLELANLYAAERKFSARFSKGENEATGWFRVFAKLTFEDFSGRRRTEYFLLMKELKYQRIASSDWDIAVKRRDNLTGSALVVEISREPDQDKLTSLWDRLGDEGRKKHCRPVGYPEAWRWKPAKIR